MNEYEGTSHNPGTGSRPQDWWCRVINLELEKGKSVEQVNASAIVRVGVDLAKRVIQVHAVDAAGRVVAARALPREKF